MAVQGFKAFNNKKRNNLFQYPMYIFIFCLESLVFNLYFSLIFNFLSLSF